MDLEMDEADADCYDDIPPLSHQEYEELMYSMYEELKREAAQGMADEFERFEEEALRAAIESQQQEGSMGCEPMDLGQEEEEE